jgi:hypothetical protein
MQRSNKQTKQTTSKIQKVITTKGIINPMLCQKTSLGIHGYTSKGEFILFKNPQDVLLLTLAMKSLKMI